MVKKRGLPMPGELVLCKITKVNPNSCECHLDEYGLDGLVHISEISSGWVRDIRNFVRVNQTAVAKVLNIDERRHISLSLKRVDKKQENEKIKESKLNQRAEKLLELAANKLGKTLEKAYDEVGYLLQEKFGTMYDAFREAMSDPAMLKRRGVPDEWIAVMKEIAEKNIEQKEFEFRARLEVRTFKPNGIILIKRALEKIESAGMEVHYVAAPNYTVKFRTLQAKKGQKEFEEKLAKIAGSEKEVEMKFEMA